MNDEKLTLNTLLLRKEPCFEPMPCVIEKVVELSHSSFERLISKPLESSYFIGLYRDLMGYSEDTYHCILAVDKEFGDGLLIESEGSSYARYAQYIPHAQDILSVFNQTVAMTELKRHIENSVNEWLEQNQNSKDLCVSTAQFFDNPEILSLLTKYAGEILEKRPEIAGISCGGGFIEATKKALIETKLFCPLTIVAEPHDEYNDLEEMPSRCFVNYEDKINEKIEKSFDYEEKDRGLITWCDDEHLEQKIFSVMPSVEVRNGNLYGVVTLKSYGELNKAELIGVTDYLEGQFADGWGESFEQKGIKLGDEQVYISFWKNNGYYLKPEVDFFQMQNHEMKM